jgi:tRNA(Ile)-lysidine synthase
MPPDTSKTVPTPSAAVSVAPDPRHDELLTSLTPVFDKAFAPYRHIVLAVSGGADSMALMNLVHAWIADKPANHSKSTLSVVTVDHALRAGSAAEATMVAAAAARLGRPHTTLTWDGPKPATGIQAAARAARYDLIRAHLMAHAWPAVATAHTADDQAETLLMRLARGSGIDGLAAMRPSGSLGDGKTLLRPLLGIAKSELVAYLTNNGIAWAEDPSNSSQSFERVRLRTSRAELATHGLDFDSKALARTAQRSARASDALVQYTAHIWSTAGDHARLDALGTATLNWRWLCAQPEDIRLRILAGLFDCIGGRPESTSLGQLEALTSARDWHPLVGTLNGTKISAADGRCTIIREWGRNALPTQTLSPGVPALWDRRFRITLSAACPTPLHLACLDTHGIDALKRLNTPGLDHPKPVLQSQPALWHGTQLVAAPTLAYVAAEWRTIPDLVACKFERPSFAR